MKLSESLKKQHQDNLRKLAKALEQLGQSYDRVKDLPSTTSQLDDNQLREWESFTSRYGRAADLFLMRYLRTAVLLDDPGTTGSFRDFLNRGEKLGLLDTAEFWMEIRLLRNMLAHEYAEDDLSRIFEDTRKTCPKLLGLSKIIVKS